MQKPRPRMTFTVKFDPARWVVDMDFNADFNAPGGHTVVTLSAEDWDVFAQAVWDAERKIKEWTTL